MPPGCYRGEFGPEIGGSNHVMIRAMAFNEHIAVSAHKHTNILVVWSKRNFKILQEVNLTGVEGTESGAAAIRLLKDNILDFYRLDHLKNSKTVLLTSLY